MSSDVRILVLGDVIGRPGIRAVVTGLSALRRTYKADFVIVNGENADEGFGLSPEISEQIFSAGADIITSGNHIWQHEDVADVLNGSKPVLRPANYPKGCPGQGVAVLNVRGVSIAVVNLQGRRRMPAIDCPFRKMRELKKKELVGANLLVVDFHAEATEEKEALAFMLDGSATLVYGTHTHVQTADERILSGGTAYITDVGATGPRDSVIGFEPEISIERSITLVPHKNCVLDHAAVLNGVFVVADAETGLAKSIERVAQASAV